MNKDSIVYVGGKDSIVYVGGGAYIGMSRTLFSFWKEEILTFQTTRMNLEVHSLC